MPTVVAALGAVAASAGVEHGVGELTQPSTDPGPVFIESWPHVAAFEPLSGEPAMTLIPDLRVSGIVTILSSLALGWWTSEGMDAATRRVAAPGPSALLLLVGGGFGPPLLGALLSIGLLRAAPERPTACPPGTVHGHSDAAGDSCWCSR